MMMMKMMMMKCDNDDDDDVYGEFCTGKGQPAVLLEPAPTVLVRYSSGDSSSITLSSSSRW